MQEIFSRAGSVMPSKALIVPSGACALPMSAGGDYVKPASR